MISEALRVISCRHGDDTALADFPIKRQQMIERAAFFEGSRELQILKFEEQRAAKQCRQSLTYHTRRVHNVGANAEGCGINMGRCDNVGPIVLSVHSSPYGECCPHPVGARRQTDRCAKRLFP
jgi:hypothetical protein